LRGADMGDIVSIADTVCLRKRIANPRHDCRTLKRNTKFEIRNAKMKPQGLCGAAIGWAIL
jgi:hypothetical protein